MPAFLNYSLFEKGSVHSSCELNYKRLSLEFGVLCS